jgi:hypothetical protein
MAQKQITVPSVGPRFKDPWPQIHVEECSTVARYSDIEKSTVISFQRTEHIPICLAELCSQINTRYSASTVSKRAPMSAGTKDDDHFKLTYVILHVHLEYLVATVHGKLRSGRAGPFVKVEGCCD